MKNPTAVDVKTFDKQILRPLKKILESEKVQMMVDNVEIISSTMYVQGYKEVILITKES